MRRVFLTLLGLFLFSVHLAAGVWMHDYDDALEKAKKEHKLILMMYVKKT